MILATLRRSLISKAEAWAKQAGATLPAGLPMNPPPPHIKADISLPWPLAAAKSVKRNPLEAAKELAAAFSAIAEVESAEAVPPGFVNVKMKDSALLANVKAVTLDPGSYGLDPDGPKTKVLIEFVSANPTGPVHLASGRGATLGD